MRAPSIHLLVSFALAGCATTNPVPIRTFEGRPALPAPAESRQVAITKLVSKVSHGAQIGTASGGFLCVPAGPITWRPGLDEPVTGEVLSVLREELKKAGYQVAGQSGSLFEESSAGQAELLLAGAIKHVTLNSCSGPQGRSSESSVEIEWQLYEQRTRSVVLTATTGGHAKASPGSRDAHLEAYIVALRNLLAQESFVAAVGAATRPAAPEYPSLALAVVTIRPPGTARTPEVLQHAQNAVVRIVRGSGHGSGVVVSATGWVLTAAHAIAGLSGPFDLELANGQRVTASLLRSNAAADVALIQLPKGAYPAMPVGSSVALRVGSPVFAIGTPLHERFSRSVTKGVVSALRPKDGRTLIQSDVVVHAGSSGGPLLDEHGRVVGLTIGGAGIGGQIGVGLNEFVGIEDAWRALQIEPQVSTVEIDTLLRR